ncbi:MSC_0621 family F1-like ATPase epsilon subunit [Metamycoplasma spumans]|uniref:MSC_0621 family F1-like ATPase epsilon subunit n=1 Tax=Metamycoplasma spumans TaxID=92406 RepID=UPI0034DD2543
MKSNGKFFINIRYEINKNVNFANASLEFYIPDDESWIAFTNDSIASFNVVLAKINYQNQDIYLFLNNASIKSNLNNIDIELLDKPQFYFNQKNIINLKEEMSRLSKNINYLKAKENISLTADEIIELREMEIQQYKLKLISLFKLVKGEING